MSRFQTEKETYNRCLSEGKIIPLNRIDINKIRTMIEIAEEDLRSAKLLQTDKRPNWNTIYKLNYDVLHILVESFLMFDKVKSLNHQCLFSYLCINHPELELDWNFFEQIRTRRNGINYYGSKVSSDDWKEIRLQLSLYTSLLKKEIKKKLMT